MPKGGPIVLPNKKLAYLLDIKMACQKVIMMPANKFDSNGLKHKK